MFHRFLAPVVAALVAQPALGVMLTASVFDTPGLPGFRTYDLTVSADDGYINAFDFFDGGISGPIRHASDRHGDDLFGGIGGSAADSHWLVERSDGVSIGAEQSLSELSAAYAFAGGSGQRDTHRNLPFVRLVTDEPSSIRLSGEFLVDRFWEDGSYRGVEVRPFDGLLSDVAIGAPPEPASLPSRPTPPWVAPPVVPEPPAVEEPPASPAPSAAPDPAPTTEVAPSDEHQSDIDHAIAAIDDQISELTEALHALQARQEELQDLRVTIQQQGGDEVPEDVGVGGAIPEFTLFPVLGHPITGVWDIDLTWTIGVPTSAVTDFVFDGTLDLHANSRLQAIEPVAFATLSDSSPATITPEPTAAGLALLAVVAASTARRR